MKKKNKPSPECKEPRLLTTTEPKTKYVLHYSNLNPYLKLGRRKQLNSPPELENQNNSRRKTTQQWEEKQFNSTQSAPPAHYSRRKTTQQQDGNNSTQQQEENDLTLLRLCRLRP
ncbi:hypothetical protein TNIN_41181 [Trichonephila inaurata madagascariensis]|uniref:Uncharacterized protein n=1 Tax=Trichonephila inaurata madagascariensis TaxID=2747483 RepID=A0A8X6YFA2_9ARAC|nr:hypothetical protein TNIN_41181 [Trichonephila inaurata madagascariensis]